MRSLTKDFEEVKLIYKNKVKAEDRPLIQSSGDAFLLLHKNWKDEDIELLETLKVLFLDNSMRLMSISTISVGGVTGTIVDPRIIFATALKRRSHNLILAHNHPSGSIKPSESDKFVTKRLILGGKLLDIHIRDHLIISRNAYYSLADNGDMELDNMDIEYGGNLRDAANIICKSYLEPKFGE